MLPKPTVTPSVLAPVLPFLDAVMMTAKEVATHWRMSPEYIANLRRRPGDGPTHVKLPSGAVRYRLSDVVLFELVGQRGLSPETAYLAIRSVPDVSDPIKDRMCAALARACFAAR